MQVLASVVWKISMCTIWLEPQRSNGYESNSKPGIYPILYKYQSCCCKYCAYMVLNLQSLGLYLSNQLYIGLFYKPTALFSLLGNINSCEEDNLILHLICLRNLELKLINVENNMKKTCTVLQANSKWGPQWQICNHQIWHDGQRTNFSPLANLWGSMWNRLLNGSTSSCTVGLMWNITTIEDVVE